MVSTFEFSRDTVGILIKAEIDTSVFEKMQEIIEEKIREFGTINLFVEIENDQHIHLLPLMKHLKFQIGNDRHYNKVAVVTGKEWFKNVLKVKDLIMDSEVKAFAPEDRMKAITWIAE